VIMEVLRQAGQPLTQTQIVRASYRLGRRCGMSERTLRKEQKLLLKRGLVTHPPGRKKLLCLPES
jgi:hypothetical protein